MVGPPCSPRDSSPFSNNTVQKHKFLGFPCASAGKESVCNAGDLGSIPGLGRSPGEGEVTHSSILAWRICILKNSKSLNKQNTGTVIYLILNTYDMLTHWKRPWCWERLKAGGEGDDRGWNGWMASPTRWTWVWVNSRSWWWTGRPGVLQFMGLQRVRHDWATELNWTDDMLVMESSYYHLNAQQYSKF